jgi:hypothetical protein
MKLRDRSRRLTRDQQRYAGLHLGTPAIEQRSEFSHEIEDLASDVGDLCRGHVQVGTLPEASLATKPVFVATGRRRPLAMDDRVSSVVDLASLAKQSDGAFRIVVSRPCLEDGETSIQRDPPGLSITDNGSDRRLQENLKEFGDCRLELGSADRDSTYSSKNLAVFVGQLLEFVSGDHRISVAGSP